jgi:hypothetical protein
MSSTTATLTTGQHCRHWTAGRTCCQCSAEPGDTNGCPVVKFPTYGALRKLTRKPTP